jgi:hypothetical protein
MQGGEFENRLCHGVPRGHTVQVQPAGHERGLFARGLTPVEMTDAQRNLEGSLLPNGRLVVKI